MNYLAHALLAGPQATDRVGGVIGDFVKGLLPPGPAWLPPALQEGVVLPRRIDSFADTDPAFRRSRARMSTERRRVAGVLVDMFYDHFLAVHWPQFHPQPLHEFTAQTYREIQAHLTHTRLATPPDDILAVLGRMATHDWLSSYRDANNIALALDRMSRHRMRTPNPLLGAGEELHQHYLGLETDFLDFMPRALRFAEQIRAMR